MQKRVRRKPSRMLAEAAAYIPAPMVEVAPIDYRAFRATHRHVTIEDVEVKLAGPWTVTSTEPPDGYSIEKTTVWSFPDRGDWATHSGNYRGNWSPFIPRNLLLRYTKPGDLVLDQMVGSGTTLVECKLLGRRAIGVDINPDAIMVTRDRLNFPFHSLDPDYHAPEIRTFVGDARNLDAIGASSVDLIATHPPYASIVSYSKDRVRGDLSSVRGINLFIEEMRKVARESMRVLRPGGHCAVLMGDTRRHRHFIPISARVMQVFLEAGFLIREDIMKAQHKMKSTREIWSGSKYDFLLLAHEHLFVFRKLAVGEPLNPFRESAQWWAKPVDG
jgi:DNA modification methylase